MPVNPFDKASRFAAKLDAPGFLGWLLGAPAEALVFRRWLDTRGLPFPGGDPDRTSDTVAHLDNAAEHGVPWAVAVEFQTVPDPDMFGRLLGYLAGLWLTLRPDAGRGSRFHVGAAVVNLTGTGAASRDLRWPGTGLATHLGVVERNLERESADELLGGIESGRWSRCLLPWVPLMTGGGDPGIIDRWKLLAEGEPDRRRRAEYSGIAQLFAERAGRKAVWQAKLEGWNVEESTVVNEWIAIGEKRGETRGRVEGRVEGRLEGRTEGQQTSLLGVLARKYGTVPEDVVASVRGTTDADRLQDWLWLVATAPDLAAFRQQAGI
ncbi:hypothetical protein [Gemmata sp.]|uniref:hypothetical protein n=1 Tax=Gemmata sp. TaxID=1914242 RepID=UPI003F6ECF9F